MGNRPLNYIDVLGLADFPSHIHVARNAIENAKINLTPDQLECFYRGNLIPDIPEFLAIAHMYPNLKIGENIERVPELIDGVKNKIPEGIRNRYNQFKDALTHETVARASYWWNDQSFFGPLAALTPKLNEAEIIKTHFGENSFMHGMGLHGQTAAEVHQKMTQEVNRLLEIYRKEKPCCKAYIALGMAAHILTDTWTPSHTIRNSEGNIQQFIIYTQQSANQHKLGDNLLDDSNSSYRNSAINAVSNMIQSGNAAGLFQLAPGASVAVPPGMNPVNYNHIITPQR